MPKRAVLLLFFSGVVLLSLGQTATKQKSEKPKKIFSIAGKPFNSDEFIYLYKKNHSGNTSDFTRQKIEEYLDLFIKFKLKVHEARKLGMDTTAAFLKEYNSYKEELRKPYLPDNTLMDSLIRLTYDRMKEDVKASHILINVKADAAPADTLKAYNRIIEIRNNIVNNKEDFGAAAVEYSEDPSAKGNRGNLNYFTALQMVYPFETAAYQTKVGDVSMPVRTRFGYHLIKVFDRRPSRGEVEVSHIMLRTKQGATNEGVKNSIFNIHEQLRAGAQWEELCTQYSEDPASKESGGKLKPFGSGAMNSAPEFETVAFHLQTPGEISDPFQTQYGWHILRLERKIPLASFETLAPGLKSRVSREERMTLSKQALAIKLRKQYRLEENASIKAKVFGTADSSLVKVGWKPPVFPNAAKEQLLTLQGKGFTVADFFNYVQKNHRGVTMTPQKYIEQLYTNFIDASILTLAEERILRENPTFTFLLQEYYEGILLFEIMEREVWNKASADSAGQQTYFNDHLDEYRAGERAKATLYSSAENNFQAQLQELIASGNDGRVFDYINLKKIKMEAGYFKRDENPVFEKISWAEGVYSVENNGMYYLAWLKQILPAGPMTFEEARSAIVSDYQTFLEKKWLDQLKKKYAVKVNEKGKKYIIQQLETK